MAADMSKAANSTPTITGFVSQHTCSDNQKKITLALAKVIAENMLPISLVESESLQQRFALLEPSYKVPCRQTMTTRLESMQATTTASLVKKLDEDAASVAVTTDIWTSLANYAYMSFTASYVS